MTAQVGTPPRMPRARALTVHLQVPRNKKLGVFIRGGADCPDVGPDIFIASFEPGGLVGQSGQFQRNDRINRINGKALKGCTHDEAIQMIQDALPTGNITFELSRLSHTGGRRTSIRARMRVRFPSVPFFAMAMFDWKAADASQLSLQARDVVEVVDVSHPDWWLARPTNGEVHDEKAPSRVPSRTTFERTLKAKGIWDVMLAQIKESSKKYPCVPPIFCWQEVKWCRGRSDVGAPLPPRPLCLVGAFAQVMSQAVMTNLPDVSFATPTPTTTRAPREEEVNGRDYHFVTEEAFKRGMEQKLFYEAGRWQDNFYGMSYDAITRPQLEGKIVNLTQSVTTLAAVPLLHCIAKTFPIIIFLKPSSLDDVVALGDDIYGDQVEDSASKCESEWQSACRTEANYNHLFTHILPLEREMSTNAKAISKVLMRELHSGYWTPVAETVLPALPPVQPDSTDTVATVSPVSSLATFEGTSRSPRTVDEAAAVPVCTATAIVDTSQPPRDPFQRIAFLRRTARGLGMGVSASADILRIRFIEPDSAASNATGDSLQVGDRILIVNNKVAQKDLDGATRELANAPEVTLLLTSDLSPLPVPPRQTPTSFAEPPKKDRKTVILNRGKHSAMSLGLQLRSLNNVGARVIFISPGSIASRSKLCVGHVIVKINGVKVFHEAHNKIVERLQQPGRLALLVAKDAYSKAYIRRANKLATRKPVIKEDPGQRLPAVVSAGGQKQERPAPVHQRLAPSVQSDQPPSGKSCLPHTNAALSDTREVTLIRNPTLGMMVRHQNGLVRVSVVAAGSVAERGGLAPGDTLLEINGLPCQTRDMAEITHLLSSQPAVKLLVAKCSMSLVETTESQQQHPVNKLVSVAPAARETRTVILTRLQGSFGFQINPVASGQGARVVSISPVGAAGLSGKIFVNDILTGLDEVNGLSKTSTRDIVDMLRNARNRVTLQLLSGNPVETMDEIPHLLPSNARSLK